MLIVSLLAPLFSINIENTSASATHTFGYTGAPGANLADIHDVIEGGVYTLNQTGIIQSITATLATATPGTYTVNTAIYQYNGSVYIKIVQTTERSIALNGTGQAFTFNFSAPQLLDAGNYLLTSWSSGAALQVKTDGVGVTAISLAQSYSATYPTALTGATVAAAQNFNIYCTYTIPQITLTSNPTISADITVNGTTYTTPSTIYNLDNLQFTAPSAVINNSLGYAFQNWLINSTTPYTDRTISLNITGDTTILANYTQTSNVYAFYGPYSETTGLALNENVTVTVHYSTAGTANDEFILNGSYAFAPSSTVQYFNYLFSDNTTRQYWVDPSETVTAFNVFRDDDLTRYTISFLDYTGLLKTYPYISAKTYINGSLYTVEKQKVDSDNTFSMNLLNGRTYQLVIGNQYYSYTYGTLLMTSTTSVQLVLRGVDFPKDAPTLLLYQYVHAYAERDFLNPLGAITVWYEDINNETTSVVIQIKYDNGTVANSTTFTGNQTFSYTWNSAVNSTNYQVIVNVTHSVYGTFYFKQYLLKEYATPTNPFSLDAFGSITGIETAWFLPALLIIFVAACFSELTAEVASVLTCIVAWILFAIGWIALTPAAIVTALALSIMAGVISVRRRYF